MTASVVGVYTSSETTGQASVSVTDTITTDDVLIVIEAGAYALSDHATGISGLGGTWEKVPQQETSAYVVWKGTGCSGTGTVSTTGAPTLSLTARRRIRVFALRDVVSDDVLVLQSVQGSATGGTAASVDYPAHDGQVVIAIGVSEQVSSSISSLSPSGWTNPSSDTLASSGGWYLETAHRVPTSSEDHAVVGAAAQVDTSAYAALVVVGEPPLSCYVAAQYVGSQSQGTATVSVGGVTPIAADDVLVVVEIENQQVTHHTSVSGLGGTWRRLNGSGSDPNMDTLQWAVWIGSDFTDATGTVTASGGSNTTGVNRRRLYAVHLVGVDPDVVTGATASQSSGTATTAGRGATLGQIVIGLGYSDSAGNAISATTPSVGWSETVANLDTNNSRRGAVGYRVPVEDQTHDVSSNRSSGTCYAGVLVIGTPPPPDAPTGLHVIDKTSTTIEVGWTAPDAGATPDGYEVRIDGGAPIDVGDTLSYEFTGLNPSTEYTIEVRAYNDNGSSAWVSLVVSTEAGTAFDLVDVLRLEVEGDPPTGKYRNLIRNPNGEYGGSGWVTPNEGFVYAQPGPTMIYNTNGGMFGEVSYFTSDPFPVKEGDWLYSRVHVYDFAADGGAEKGIAILNQFAGPDGDFYSGWSYDYDIPDLDINFTPGTYQAASELQAPAGAVRARVVIVYTNPDEDGETVSFDSAQAIILPSSTGSPPWSDVVDEVDWINILGSGHELRVYREAWNLGTIEAVVLNDDLDPNVEELLHPGRPVRMTVFNSETAQWEPIFTGRIAPQGVRVRYDMRYLARYPQTKKATRISLTVVDPMQQLATIPSKYGQAGLVYSPNLLEGTGVRWHVDPGEPVLGTPVWGPEDGRPRAEASSNFIDGGTVADQVAIVRDGNHGYAWIDREGIAHIHHTPPDDDPIELDETRYSDLGVTYDTGIRANLIYVNELDYNPGTDEATETLHGPFVDSADYFRRGEVRATFTVNHNTLDSYTNETPEEFALAVFASSPAGATVESVTVPVRSLEDIQWICLLDMYQAVHVSNDLRGIDVDTRIVGIEHRITLNKWLVTLRLAPADVVPRPQVVPTSGGASS